MSKFISFYHHDDGRKEKIGDYSNREDAVKACVNYNSHDTCLDSKQDRKEGLENRDFYIIGCGPRQLSIEEIL